MNILILSVVLIGILLLSSTFATPDRIHTGYVGMVDMYNETIEDINEFVDKKIEPIKPENDSQKHILDLPPSYNLLDECTSRTYDSKQHYIQPRNPKIVKLANELSDGMETDVDKVQAIHEWIRKNIEYELEMPESTLNQILTTKKADCSGMSFLFTSLAKSMGLESYVVFAKSSITPYDHSYIIVLVNNETWLPIETTIPVGIHEFTNQNLTQYYEPFLIFNNERAFSCS